MIKLLHILFLFISIFGMSHLVASNSRLQIDKNSSVSVYFDETEASITFAAQDLKNILNTRGTKSTLKPLSKLKHKPKGTYVVIAKDIASVKLKLTAAGGKAVGSQQEQGYALRITQTASSKGYWVLGADRIGAMYGGIHLGELVKADLLANLTDEDQAPYIAKRGLKFNIPLDIRQPSHGENWRESTSPQKIGRAHV